MKALEVAATAVAARARERVLFMEIVLSCSGALAPVSGSCRKRPSLLFPVVQGGEISDLDVSVVGDGAGGARARLAQAAAQAGIDTRSGALAEVPRTVLAMLPTNAAARSTAQVALPVGGDDVTAVVQHHHVHQALEIALQIPGLVEVGAIFPTWVDDQRWLADVADLGTDGVD
jgi:hypothetical protein